MFFNSDLRCLVTVTYTWTKSDIDYTIITCRIPPSTGKETRSFPPDCILPTCSGCVHFPAIIDWQRLGILYIQYIQKYNCRPRVSPWYMYTLLTHSTDHLWTKYLVEIMTNTLLLILLHTLLLILLHILLLILLHTHLLILLLFLNFICSSWFCSSWSWYPFYFFFCCSLSCWLSNPRCRSSSSSSFPRARKDQSPPYSQYCSPAPDVSTSYSPIWVLYR